MKAEFICYSKCSTCQKAKKFLLNQEIEFSERQIVEDKLSKEEILSAMAAYDGEAKNFFNSSGKVYRELGLKNKIKAMSRQDMAEILSSDGMLVKRPILWLENQVLLGFNEELWQSALATIK